MLELADVTTYLLPVHSDGVLSHHQMLLSTRIYNIQLLHTFRDITVIYFSTMVLMLYYV